MDDKVINIGYGNQGLISYNEFYIDIELYYGEVSIEVPNVQIVLENWGNDSFLDLFNSSGVGIWYEDGKLNFEDNDGCGFSCDKDRFIELFC